MSIAKVELIGGAFQSSEGEVLANGYLIMKLSQDSVVNTSQICSGVEIRIDLDANGDVAVYPSHAVQSVWGNDHLSPANSFYRVTGYKASGQPAWGPNNQQVIGNGGTFDVGTWVPNSVISWTPSVQRPELKVNGVPNVDQQLLNFIDTASVSWTDNGDGSVQADAVGGGFLELVAESHQTLSGSNVVFVTPTLGGSFSKGLYSYFISAVLHSSGTEIASLEYSLSYQSYGGVVANNPNIVPPPGDVTLSNAIGGSSVQLNDWVGTEFGGQAGFALQAQPSLRLEFFTDAVNPLSFHLDLWVYKLTDLP
jgi:hypothetical protein